MNKMKQHLLSLSVGLFYVLSVGHPVLADDTEVLVGVRGAGTAAPNVLFIIDTSGSMSWGVDGTSRFDTGTGPTRLSLVQDVFTDLMNNTEYHGMNVALMRFSQNGGGGYFVAGMQELTTETAVTMILASNSLTAHGDTPLSETLYEAALFWGGRTVYYGDSSTPDKNVNAVMDADITLPSYTNNTANYISPITTECSKNYTILLTDGSPNQDWEADARIQDLPSYLSGACNDNPLTGTRNNCLNEVAEYLYTIDQNTTIAEKQTVITHTIGFLIDDQTLLVNTAADGGGIYTPASSKLDLAAAFSGVLDTIADSNNSFSPPAMSVNAFNGISHFNRLYFALFEPDTLPKWNGNVKPYALNDDYQLVDADGTLAIGPGGTFLTDSRSFWSDTADGANIVTGGANGHLPTAASRNLYTYTDVYSPAGVPDTPSLTAISNGLTTTNTDITAAQIGLPTDATTTQRSDLIDAVRAFKLGAPLHSQPALVTYGGTEDSPDLTLFVGTNDGFLHAINASNYEGQINGEEKFAFIPKELLGNLANLNKTTAGAMIYGLDGGISVWVKEDTSDTDVTIDTSDGSGDHVYLYIGMRRGGNNYYAMDVTDRDAPQLKWVIQGGTEGGTERTTGFGELGQSWSKPSLATIQYNGSSRKVVIFGGGYDAAQDANPINNAEVTVPGTVPGTTTSVDHTDTIGRAIYIVDADDGELLWSAGPTDSGATLELSSLTHSIPSDVQLLDSDLDGYIDRLYVADISGQLFRFDFESSDLTATGSGITGSGVVLASLSGNTESENRRFYYAPDVVIAQEPGTAPYVAINIGSGYRAHPLNPRLSDGTLAPLVDDRFYSLRDPFNVRGPIPEDTTVTTPIVNSDLFDVTDSLASTDTEVTELADAITDAKGWYLELNGTGEKVLAPAITINGEIYFTTYTPPAINPDPDSCTPDVGTGLLYQVSLFNAMPTRTRTGTGTGEDGGGGAGGDGTGGGGGTTDTPTTEGRAKDIGGGIPPGATVMFREDSGVGNCVGTDCNEIPDVIQIEETYWRDGT
ncbi:MAG: hypothetical protein COB30_020130 [Ectothiorhodospiraceae bacterium]|nr:hypothetical protein [Ectothiorhodospiraceae bacterium]